MKWNVTTALLDIYHGVVCVGGVMTRLAIPVVDATIDLFGVESPLISFFEGKGESPGIIFSKIFWKFHHRTFLSDNFLL